MEEGRASLKGSNIKKSIRIGCRGRATEYSVLSSVPSRDTTTESSPKLGIARVYKRMPQLGLDSGILTEDKDNVARTSWSLAQHREMRRRLITA